jgi:WD40 repeat protein
MKKLTCILFLFQLVSALSAQDPGGVFNLSTEQDIIYTICYSAKGGVLAVGDNYNVKVFNSSSRALLGEFEHGHRKQILSADISRDSTIMVTGGKDSTIVVWDFLTRKVVRKLLHHSGLVTCVKLSNDGRYLVSCGTDKSVFLYDLASASIVSKFSDFKDDLTTVTFSPDGSLIVTGGADGMISVYSCTTFKKLASFKGHTDFVRDLSFSHDGKRLVSCGDDARIVKWDCSDPEHISMIMDRKEGHEWILCMSKSTDDEIFAYGDNAGNVKVLWPRGIYARNVKVPVQRILLRPMTGNEIEVAVATRGKGVMIINGSGFKLETKVKYNFFPYKS